MESLFQIEKSMLYIFMAFTLGIIFGNFVVFSLIWLIGLLFLFALVIFFNRRKNYSIFLFLLFLIFLWGVFWVVVNNPSEKVFENYQGEYVEFQGEVNSINAQHNQFLMAIDSFHNQKLKTKPTVLVVVPSYLQEQKIMWGDYIKVRGIFLKTSVNSNPGEFSERDYWKSQGIVYKIIANQDIIFLAKSEGIKGFFNNLRIKIFNNLEKGISGEEVPLALGLILGDKSQMDADLYSLFQRLGVVHIFAVSGLHVGVLVSLYFWLAAKLKLSQKYSLAGAILIFGSYAILTGLTPSVLRASLMALVSMVLMSGLKYKDNYSILSAAALVILIINPSNLWMLGFQLSFITTWGLIYLYPTVQRSLFFLPARLQKVLAVPIAAQLAALPVTIYHFHNLSFWAPLANIIYVAIVGLLVPLLFIAIIISLFIFFLAEPFLYLASGILFFLSETAVFLTSTLPYSSFNIQAPQLSQIIIYFCLLIALVEIERLRRLLSLQQRLICAILIVLVLFIGSLPNPQLLQYTFLDVGQGDSTIVRTPYDQFLVIDGGPSSKRVRNYLQYLGANKVELVLLSHSDSDHLNGLYKIIEDIPTKNLIFSAAEDKKAELTEIKRLATLKNTEIIPGQKGMQIKCHGGLRIKIISPEEDGCYTDANNASLVFEASYGAIDALFTGDVEQGVIKKIIPFLRKIEILKVPHHGSKTSYSPLFYDCLEPEIAIIQAGLNNRYGHPHLEVIEALEQREVRILRNDQHGAVFVETDGSKIKIQTFLKENNAQK